MSWILTACTASWLMCGSIIEREYRTEEQCYKAMNIMYDRHGEASFKWIICAPKEEGK